MNPVENSNIMEFIEENTFTPETKDGAENWKHPNLILTAESKILEWLGSPSEETIMLCSDQLFLDIDEDLKWIDLGRFEELFQTRGKDKGKLRETINFTNVTIINADTYLPLILFEWHGYKVALLTNIGEFNSTSWLHITKDDFLQEIKD
jgi:hypothetical protein